MDIQKQVEYFKGLPYEVKRNKVLDMLKKLQRTHETFAMFYKTINEVKNISEQVLVYIYQGIMEIATEIEAGRHNNIQEKIKKISEVLMMIKKQEEMEREREGNPDDILKSL